MKTRMILLMMIISSVPAMAGFREKLPIHWDKISPSEFSVVPEGRDSAAVAIVLCDFGNIEITNRTFYTRHTRIKILKEAGLHYASVEIPYQTKNRHDVFYELKAHTLIMENGKIIDYKVLPGQIEDIKINDQWSKKKFTFPNASPGVIVEFQYTIASLDFEKLDTWYFQREIPTLWSELRFQVPSPFIYLVSFENNRQLAQDEEIVYGQKLQWLYDTQAWNSRLDLVRSNYLLFNTFENRYKVWAMNNVKKKIVMKNLPGLSASFEGQPVAYNYPQVRFDLFESSGNLPRTFRPLVITTHKDYETRGEWELMHDQFALTGFVQFRLKTWEQFNANLLENERFGQYLIKNARGAKLNDSIAGESASKQELMNAIFNYVHNNYNWNGQFSLYASQDFNRFIGTQTGSSAEINLMLVNLLRKNGIKSDPLLIRTSDMGMPEKMYPVKGQFNHVIALAEIDGASYLLDATSSSSDLNKLNKLDMGTQGWIVREENPGWMEIFPAGEKQDEGEVGPVFRL
jgi:hypothetical protein